MMARWIRAGRMAPLDFDETCVRLAVAQPPQASPILLWAQSAERFPFALIVPLRMAPGRRNRWAAWGLASAVAAYRQFGVPAYLDHDEIWLGGRAIAETVAEAIGESVVVASAFIAQFPGSCVPTPSGALEQAFRLRLEAQHGWQFEHSWPTRPEMVDVAHA